MALGKRCRERQMAMRSIVRKDSGKGWKDYTKKLAR